MVFFSLLCLKSLICLQGREQLLPRMTGLHSLTYMIVGLWMSNLRKRIVLTLSLKCSWTWMHHKKEIALLKGKNVGRLECLANSQDLVDFIKFDIIKVQNTHLKNIQQLMTLISKPNLSLSSSS